MKKIFTLAAIALFTLASCSDNDATPTTPEENVVLLKKTIENDVDGDFTTTYAYDGTKLTGINYSDGTYDAITYTGDLITQWVEYYEDGSTHTKFIYEYNSQQKLKSFYWLDYEYDTFTKYDYTYLPNGSISYTVSYSDDEVTFNIPGDGGMIYPNRVEEYITDDIPEPYTYAYNNTYDDKNNPLKNVTGFEKINFAGTDEGTNFGHNITIIKATNSNGNSEQTLFTCSYVYNPEGYPVSSTGIYNGTDITETQYFYE